MYPLLFLRSSTSFLRLLPRLPVTSIPPFLSPSITCHRRQFLRKMWPIQLAFWLPISCRRFLRSFILSTTNPTRTTPGSNSGFRGRYIWIYKNQRHTSQITHSICFTKDSSITDVCKDKLLWETYQDIIMLYGCGGGESSFNGKASGTYDYHSFSLF
jgi:hypothetical protein